MPLAGLAGKRQPFFDREFLHNYLIQWVSIPTLVVNVANWAVLFFFIRTFDFLIILHYNAYFGVDVTGYRWQAYYLPGVATAFLLINAFLSHYFYVRRDRVAAYLFLLAALVLQIGTSIAIAGVILINY